MVFNATVPAMRSGKSRRSGKSNRALCRRLAALAGAAGAATVGSDADAAGLTLVPTAGVSAASGIPGFSFTDVNTITSGSLQPPATAGGIDWDVDGNSQADFRMRNLSNVDGLIVPLSPFTQNANGLLVTGTSPDYQLRNALNLTVGASGANTFVPSQESVVFYGQVIPGFTDQISGQFGFKFAYGNTPGQYLYGWASLTPDLSLPNHFTITQAYYSSSPIAVGAVPVPEPSSMALLAVGSAGVAAWRARKKQQG